MFAAVLDENGAKSKIANDISKNSLRKSNSQVLNKENVKSSEGTAGYV